MSEKTGQMHLGAFLFGVGHHIAAWRYPDTEAHGIMDPAFYERFARTAERGKFDMLFLADSLALLGGSPSHTVSVRPEPITLLSYLAGVTERIGLAATVSTTYHEPYSLAREFATVDHLSGGRTAWNVVTSSRNEEAANFSKEKHPDHTVRYDRAREFIRVATTLWDSWEDDAILLDRGAGRFANSDKVHRIDHHGDHFKVRGPLNAPRPPQGGRLLFRPAPPKRDSSWRRKPPK